MKINKFFLLFLALLLIFIIAACSSSNTPTPLPEDQSASSSIDCSTVPTPSIDVAAMITEKLQNHHDSGRIYNAQHTREEWNATLDRMISYGANISEDEKQIIIDYLFCKQQ